MSSIVYILLIVARNGRFRTFSVCEYNYNKICGNRCKIVDKKFKNQYLDSKVCDMLRHVPKFS